MSILTRFRNAARSLFGSTDVGPASVPPVADPGDGHAPGHRHLGPPPRQSAPTTVDTEQPTAQPWVRTTHSDSQQRRFRR